MATVPIQGPHPARPAVEVFIRAPEREVDAPIRQPMRHRADRMRAVEADQDASGSALAGDPLDVEQLPAPVDDRRQDRERNLVRHRLDDRPFGERPAILAGDQDEVVRGVEPPEPEVAFDRVEVGREAQASRPGSSIEPRSAG